jgi:hypothetical protein
MHVFHWQGARNSHQLQRNSGPMNYTNTIQQHKSNNNTIFDRTDYETCYKTNI